LPIALIGSENKHVFGSLKKWRRAPVSLRVGKMFRLDDQASARQEALKSGTGRIMAALAELLPKEYRG
jgi:hypothetical protein